MSAICWAGLSCRCPASRWVKKGWSTASTSDVHAPLAPTGTDADAVDAGTAGADDDESGVGRAEVDGEPMWWGEGGVVPPAGAAPVPTAEPAAPDVVPSPLALTGGAAATGGLLVTVG